MADMDDFLGKVVVDTVNDANRLSNQMDGVKLIGQRQINVLQQERINNDREYIRKLEETIRSLKDDIQRLERNSGPGRTWSSEQARHLGIVQTNIAQAEFFINNDIDYDPYKTPEQNMNDYELSKSQNANASQTAREYEALLSKPFHEIAQRNGKFKEAYEKQMEMMADWMVSQKAFKELAIEFGFEAHGYTPEQVIEMGQDKVIDVLQDKHNPSHITNAADAHEIGPRKEALIDKYHVRKAARKAKKGS